MKVLHGPGGIKIYLDSTDPDTPCIVAFKDATATFHCVMGEGEVEHYQVSDEQWQWLNKHSQYVEDFYDKYRVIQG